MTDRGAPPPRPSTARVTAAPMAVLRDLPRPRVVSVSFWCWVAASVVVGGIAVLLSTKSDPMRAEFARLARISDPRATQVTIERVADVSVVLVLGIGVILGLLGVLLAGAMRAGRNWARLTLTVVAVAALIYGAFVATAMTDAMVGGLRSPVSAALLGYLAAVIAATICMFLPGTHAWSHRPRAD